MNETTDADKIKILWEFFEFHKENIEAIPRIFDVLLARKRHVTLYDLFPDKE